MLQDLYRWTLAWAQAPYAEFALFSLAVAEASFFPIPPDVLLIAMGVADPERALFYALITSLGSLFGGTIGYGIGRWGGRPIVTRLLAPEKLRAVQDLYNRYDLWAIVIAGFTPLPYKIFTVSAGLFHIRFRTLLLGSLLSRPTRFFLVGGALTLWGEAIQQWIENYFNLATGLFVVLLIAGFLVVRLVGRKKIATTS